jgi:hypothetical protein
LRQFVVAWADLKRVGSSEIPMLEDFGKEAVATSIADIGEENEAKLDVDP